MDTNDQTTEWITQYGSTELRPLEVSNTSALGLPAAWCLINFLSRTLGRLPKRVRISNSTERREDAGHWVARLLNRKCNDYASPSNTFATWYHHAALYGNGFIYIERDKKRLTNIDPLDVVVYRVDGRKYFYVKSWKPEPTKAVPNPPPGVVLDNTEVMHLMGLSHNGVWGLNPLTLLANTLEHVQELERFAVSYFRNGTHINGVIEMPAGMTKEQIEAMRTTFAERYSGAVRAGKTPIIPFGGTWKNTTANNEQSQLAELSKLGTVKLCQIFNLPPTVAYQIDGAGAWSTIESLDKHLVKYSLAPWIEGSESEYDKLYTTAEIDKGYYTQIDSDSLLRGDPAFLDAIIKKRNNGIATPNECREELDLAPQPGGDTLREPVNLTQPVDAAPSDAPTDAPAAPTNADPATPSSPPVANYSAVFSALVEDAAERIDTKTLKAMENKAGLAPDAYAAWKTHFAKEQGVNVLRSFAAIATSYEAATGKTIDLAPLAARYEAALAGTATDQLYISHLSEDAKELFQ